MNKDFLSKPISLKDIDFNSLKKLKNKKEILIGILIFVYIVVILLIGKSLLNERAEMKSEYESKEIQYNALKSSISEAEIKANILKLEDEKDALADVVTAITPADFNGVFDEFKKGVQISWDKTKEEVTLRSDVSDYPDYDIYIVSIKDFSGTFEQIKDFLEYVESYPRIVRIDTIEFKQNQITGKLNGQIRISFYFKKLAE